MREKLLSSKSSKRTHIRLYCLVVRMDTLFVLQETYSPELFMRLDCSPVSNFHSGIAGIGVVSWKCADISSTLDSGQHLNSCHLAIFLKLNMETTYFTHFFAKAHPRPTNSSFALLMKMCVLADGHVT